MIVYNINERIFVCGKGSPVVLIHGMGGPKIWGPIAEYLAKHYTVVIPTFPGFIKEDGIIKYSDQIYVDFLETVRVQLGFNKWSAIGISMGGRTVLNYALQYENNLSHLVVIDSAGLNNFSPLCTFKIGRKIMSYLIKGMLVKPQKAKKLALQDFTDTQSKIALETADWFSEMISNPAVRNNFSNILPIIGNRKHEWQNTLRRIDLPTLILWSSTDKTCPVRYADQLKSIIHNSAVSVLEGYGHMGLLEQPEFFIQHIIKFLEG